MAILMRSELEGIAAEQIEPYFAQLLEQKRRYPGFIRQASGPTQGLPGHWGLRDAGGA
jgi:hypothetical protein